MKKLVALILIGVMILPATLCFASVTTIISPSGSASITCYSKIEEAQQAGVPDAVDKMINGNHYAVSASAYAAYQNSVNNEAAASNQGEVMGNIREGVNQMGNVMDALKPDINRGFSFFGTITDLFRDGNSFLLAAGLILVSLITGYNLLFLLAPIYSDQRESMASGGYGYGVNSSSGGKKEPPFLYPATKKVIKQGGQDQQGQELSSTQIISRWFTDMAGVWIVVVLYIAFTSGGLFKLISWALNLFNVVF